MPDEREIVQTYLPDHIILSRAEPGCISFKVTQTADPMVWQLDQTFVDQPSFTAHQTRTRRSVWWAKSQGLARDFKVTSR